MLARALNKGRDSVHEQLEANLIAVNTREQSTLVHAQAVKDRIAAIDDVMADRQSCYQQRTKIQNETLQLLLYPTTTIGSFPQTQEIRQTRKDYRNRDISKQQYTDVMKQEIANCVREQELLGLDVLVHGEPERNDMVEYFGEQLTGYAFTRFG